MPQLAARQMAKGACCPIQYNCLLFLFCAMVANLAIKDTCPSGPILKLIQLWALIQVKLHLFNTPLCFLVKGFLKIHTRALAYSHFNPPGAMFTFRLHGNWMPSDDCTRIVELCVLLLSALTGAPSCYIAIPICILFK